MTTKPIKKQVLERTFEAYEGDTWNSFRLTWRNPDNTIIDFSTATARCQFKNKRSDATALLTLTELSGITLTNTAPNISIDLTATQTATLGKGSFNFDLEITQNGVVRTYADCVLVLKQSVTQPAS